MSQTTETTTGNSNAIQKPTELVELSAATQARFDREVAKYPPEERRSAVMACLAIVQQERGHIDTAAEKMVAAYLGMPAIAVHEITTFYNMYNQQPVGQFKINVCTNLSCRLRSGQDLMDYVCRKLHVEPYGTSADGVFTVQPSECMGACADAPVLTVNDRNMCSFMSKEHVDQLIDGLRSAAKEDV